ncbi:MAG: SUMF1/EgtB/PvdO family nonheme iron enzyme [Pirellulales bacterium]|nr:SUMF1/EgtB/PvdO family nonheme iron enzyme [Pirellulales bacterium]
MRNTTKKINGIILQGVVLLGGVFLLNAGVMLNEPGLAGVGGVVVVFALARAFVLRRKHDREHALLLRASQETARRKEHAVKPRAAAAAAIDPTDSDALVAQMLAQDRYALLLRAQLADNLCEAHFGKALAALGEQMALVPDGEVALEETDSPRVVAVQRLFLDRYPVTNREYYEFVAAGGYRQMALWDESVLPAVLDFVDRTDQSGPKYWENGCYPAGEDRHPVVGVSWFEAAAYARWAGKRLPSDAEWVKAGCWPVPLSNTARSQRRYPWGDTMDRSKANLWGSGPGRTVPVDEYAAGVSVGGVYQLIGNVWEWTSSGFRGTQLPQDHLPSSGLVLDAPLRSIRGGAFDTYFDNQAACQFQSGENPLSRRHNIGFRCAVGVGDLILVRKPTEVKPTEKIPEAEELQFAGANAE